MSQLATAQMGRISYCVNRMTWKIDELKVAVSEFISITSFFVAMRPNEGQGLLIHEVSRSHTTTHHNR